ncbi:hypothetical protein V6N13_032909 [Hibiscus sabdariffa]
MLFPRGSPAAVATGTKIYVFGSVSATEGYFAEVFDTEGIRWETVPPPPVATGLVPSSASDPVLLDSPRSRIPLHFCSNGSLHAFYPDDGSWEWLEPVFGRFVSCIRHGRQSYLLSGIVGIRNLIPENFWGDAHQVEN